MREHREKWDVRFMSWNDFSEGVISRDGNVWNILTSADLVIGGVNFTGNFLWATFLPCAI
jgi:hypothetical protein